MGIRGDEAKSRKIKENDANIGVRRPEARGALPRGVGLWVMWRACLSPPHPPKLWLGQELRLGRSGWAGCGWAGWAGHDRLGWAGLAGCPPRPPASLLFSGAGLFGIKSFNSLHRMAVHEMN